MKTTIVIEGMSCGCCTASVKETLEKLAGVTSVAVDLDSKKAEVTHDGASAEAMREAVEDAGFDVVSIG